VPINPESVSSRASLYYGTTFGVDVGGKITTLSPDAGHLSDLPTGTTPLLVDKKQPFVSFLNKSKKIAPDQIEVVWGRKIWSGAAAGTETSLDGDSTLSVDPVQNGMLLPGENPHDRFRVRDVALPQVVDGTGVEVSYLFGHPTESALSSLSLFSNWAAYFNATALPTKTYSVAMQLVGLLTPAGVRSPGITAPDAADILKEVNTIWSQVSVEFTAPTAAVVQVANPGLFDPYAVDSRWQGLSTHKLVPNLRPSPAIDVYFVHALLTATTDWRHTTAFPNPASGDRNNGETFFPGQGVATNPGILIGISSNAMMGPRSIHDIARTLAHELGHYLMKLDDHAHDVPRWNLMASAAHKYPDLPDGTPDILADDRKRDLTTAQWSQIKVIPGSEDL
jgi:hypothetical protein